jgi:DNA repair protein RadD
MITLRKNQTEPIRKAIAFFNAKNPAPSLIVLPTAWGKSILTAFTAKGTGDKLLVLQPSKELLEQNYKKYISLCDFEAQAGIYSASFGQKNIEKVTYATIGSIKNLGKLFKQLGFKKMLIDEAHLYPREADSMLGAFLSESGITHVLGITATPIKLQQNTDVNGGRFSKLVMLTSRSKKGNFFKDIIHVGQVCEMVEMGFWSKLQYNAANFDGSMLVYNSTKSEYTEESVARAFQANNIHQRIKQQLDENTDRKHILVFVPTVQEAIDLSRQYPDSAAIYGEMRKVERETAINDFRSGKTRVMFNVRVLSTGFDYTGIDCIILGISTASVALYYQIVGRATRIDAGKEDALIIDLAGNVSRFGRVEDITFEKGRIWRMFGTGGKLLSGIPIHDIGKLTREDVVSMEDARRVSQPMHIMPFGKYKGNVIADIPLGYRQWMLSEFKWTPASENLRRAISQTLSFTSA